jgi:predicted RNA methylase
MSLDVPYQPTPLSVVSAMLDLAEVGPDDILIDLGCGDGRIVMMAAYRGAMAIGIDNDPQCIIECNALAGPRMSFYLSEIENVNLRVATVITMFLNGEAMKQLERRMMNDIDPGTRIVSYVHMFPNWEPSALRHVARGGNIFLWRRSA